VAVGTGCLNLKSSLWNKIFIFIISTRFYINVRDIGTENRLRLDMTVLNPIPLVHEVYDSSLSHPT
jgi:hypothetical protein